MTDALGLTAQERQYLEITYDGLDPDGDDETTCTPSRPTAVVPAQVPPDAVPFIGRAKEMAQLDAHLADDHPAAALVNVSGNSGAGKTTLAAHWAHLVARRFTDGQLFANLRGFGSLAPNPTDPNQVLKQFLRVLGVDGSSIPDQLEERSKLYRSLIRDRNMLIVLDDASSERQVRPLLPASPSCRVLITSRVRLAALEGIKIIELNSFEFEQAFELLSKIAGQEKVSAEKVAAAKILRLCDFLPLAVRIAAARLAARPHWSLRALAERLIDEQRRLDELVVGDLEMRASIACSYKRLSEPQRILFRRLGLLSQQEFPGWVAAPLMDISYSAAEPLIESLAEVHLIECVGEAGVRERYYRLHSLLRAYASECAIAEEVAEEMDASLRRLRSALGEKGHTHVA